MGKHKHGHQGKKIRPLPFYSSRAPIFEFIPVDTQCPGTAANVSMYPAMPQMQQIPQMNQMSQMQYNDQIQMQQMQYNDQMQMQQIEYLPNMNEIVAVAPVEMATQAAQVIGCSYTIQDPPDPAPAIILNPDEYMNLTSDMMNTNWVPSTTNSASCSTFDSFVTVPSANNYMLAATVQFSYATSHAVTGLCMIRQRDINNENNSKIYGQTIIALQNTNQNAVSRSVTVSVPCQTFQGGEQLYLSFYNPKINTEPFMIYSVNVGSTFSLRTC